MRLSHTEAAGLIEQWNSFLNTQLWGQLSGNTFEGWSRVSHKAIHAFESCSSFSQDSWDHKSRKKRGNFPLTITPSGPLEKKFASCSQDLILGWYREKLYCSRMENVSARRHSKRCIELEAKISPPPPPAYVVGFLITLIQWG